MFASSLVQEYLDRILKARVYEAAVQTPLELAPRLSCRLGAKVYLKREDQQPVFSFKIRGAYNRMRQLTAEERAKGVICSSAGNHAQGVALSGRKLGVKTCIVMPGTTPMIKVDAVRNWGGEVVLFGDSYQEAQGEAMRRMVEQDLIYIHPYDDPEVIAGQGTIGLELLRQLDPETVDAVFVPIGGGGLISGIGACMKALYPHIRIVGVEPIDAASMTQSLSAGRIVELSEVGLFADGVAVKKVGANTFALCQEVVDEMITVDTDAICAAIKDVFEDTRTILEPAGALAVAGCKAWRRRHPEGEPVVIALACGANMNFDRLRHVAERAEFGEEREALLAVTIPEVPGSFRTFCEALGERGITEFNYRYAHTDQAHVFVGLQVNGVAETSQLIASLDARGYACVNLTGDEFAKLHLRHLVGGPAPLEGGERLFRFEFPERPGALLRFLTALPPSCNITLFHYRNQGADVGRVLTGLQVPDAVEVDFEAFLEKLGYEFVEETGHPASTLFL
ncbi:MAG: threonine ammonia-lyase, biosynthetic [Kiritimatiellia bacterium]